MTIQLFAGIIKLNEANRGFGNAGANTDRTSGFSRQQVTIPFSVTMVS